MKSRISRVVLLLLVGTGSAISIFWLSLDPEVIPIATANPPLLGTVAIFVLLLTTLNLFLRWLRWQFLMRRIGLKIPAVESVTVWFGLLPSIATPFYIGEILRGLIMARKYSGATRNVLAVWIVERISDVSAIGIIILVMFEEWQFLGLIGASALFIGALTRNPNVGHRMPFATRFAVFIPLLATSLLAWMLPMLGLRLIVQSTGATISLAQAVQSFSSGTLIGSVTGIPLGIGVSGSLMILSLEAFGISSGAATVSIALFRALTSWFALTLGFAVLLGRRRQLLAMVRPQIIGSHFDLIANVYENQIPKHTQTRLIKRKVSLIQGNLPSDNGEHTLKGLDIGSGQAWYAIELASSGFSLHATDLSLEQLRKGSQLISSAPVNFTNSDARKLPYNDASFDFAYAINLIHHMDDSDFQHETFEEIVRVLKPQGRFFLHEINTENPLFRLYMGYLFPLLRSIDIGTEEWISPRKLPNISGGVWNCSIAYFNFLPDFTPKVVVKVLQWAEQILENSLVKSWSSHYMAILHKRPR